MQQDARQHRALHSKQTRAPGLVRRTDGARRRAQARARAPLALLPPSCGRSTRTTRDQAIPARARRARVGAQLAAGAAAQRMHAPPPPFFVLIGHAASFTPY